MPNATIKLIGQEDREWEVELQDPKHFDDLVGRDVLQAFCRCFVHADRLRSIISCTYTSMEYHCRDGRDPVDSVAFARDLDTQVWFAAGTFRELALSIRNLRSALGKRGRLKHESAPWITLRKLEQQWEDDEFCRRMRNVAAFHVDRECVNQGLDKLLVQQRVTLAKGQGKRAVDSRLPLGFLALYNGLGVEPDEYRTFLDAVRAGLDAAAPAIQDAFVRAAKEAGVRFKGFS